MQMGRIPPPLKNLSPYPFGKWHFHLFKYFDQKILYPYKTKILEEWEYLVTSYMMLWFTIYCWHGFDKTHAEKLSGAGLVRWVGGRS